tara:strand:- start:234 stop:512 length:279 start_codon:yes stop_codon:yes gene_type:complete
MGKLTVNEAEQLQKSGVLSKKAVEEMQEKGLVSTRRRGTKRVMKTADGGYVTPQLYFQGLKGNKYSTKMTELKTKFNDLVNEYTIENKGKSQ